MSSRQSFHVVRYDSARAFLDANLAVLLRREAEYNLTIGIAIGLRDDERRDSNAVLLAVEDADGEQVGQAIRSSPERPLVLTHMPDGALECLIEELTRERLALNGCVGPYETASPFVTAWSAATGVVETLRMRQLVYEARTIVSPPSEGGTLELAGETRADLARDWTLAFARDCDLPQRDARWLEERISGLLGKGCVFFWVSPDGQPVAMAARVRESPNGATVSLVYTPPELRRRGYAMRAVAALSRRILESGKSFCSLYTDAANPSSNSIYMKIGYNVVGESALYEFAAGSTA